MSDTTTITQKILASLEFGEASSMGFETNEGCIADGGWIGITVPVLVRGTEIGNALIGAWIYTDTDTADVSYTVTEDILEECQRSGFAIRAYDGGDRELRLHPGQNDITWQETFGLTDEEVDTDEYIALDIENEILDLAEKHAAESDIGYQEIFEAALREKLADADGYYIYALMKAVRALEGKL